jgi:hypothetical protein
MKIKVKGDKHLGMEGVVFMRKNISWMYCYKSIEYWCFRLAKSFEVMRFRLPN